MRCQIRKWKTMLIAILALTGVFLLQGSAVYAEGEDAGGTRADAKEIDLDKTYMETIANREDEDYFKFVTTEHGYFQIHLAQNAADSNEVGDGWKVNILDQEGEEIISSDQIKKNWTSIVLPYAEAGRVFYVQVIPYNSYATIPQDCVYDLTVNQTVTADWEAEPNEIKTEATIIQTNKKYNGIIIDREDEDYFKFTTTVDGYFQVRFAHNAADSNEVGSGWKVSVLDQEGEEITSSGQITKNWISINIPYAKKGKVFYVQVTPYNSYATVPQYCVYDLTINQKATTTWEAEPNEIKTEATVIQTNKKYNGIIIDREDEDYFKFTTTVAGYFQVKFAQNAADSNEVGQGWQINILDEAGEEILSSGQITKNWTSIVLPYAKAGRVFYVQVIPYNSYATVPQNCVYNLTVNQKATKSWELEPNGTIKKATFIKIGKKYSGITKESRDEDYYKLNVSATGKLNVKLSSSDKNPSNSVDGGWDVVIYDKKSNEIGRISEVKTIKSASFDVKKGTYYIQVKANSIYSAPVQCQYILSTDYVKAPAKPNLSSVKAKKKSAVVKWKKVSGANGYYVYRSTAKKTGYKKVQTLKKATALSWTNKKLKSGKRYYYKVAAYKKDKGMTVISAYSAVKSVKVK